MSETALKSAHWLGWVYITDAVERFCIWQQSGYISGATVNPGVLQNKNGFLQRDYCTFGQNMEIIRTFLQL